MEMIRNNSIDLVVTSPPYNMRTRIRNGKYTTREKSEHFSKKYSDFDDAMPIDEFYNLHNHILSLLLTKSKIVIYNFQIVTGSKEAFFRLMGNFNKEIKDVIIWDKGHGQPAMHEKVLNSAYEMIFILENNTKAGRVIENAKFKRGELSNIIRISTQGKDAIKGHGATFPIELATTLIKNFSNEGDMVYDPFMGTGTTALACIKTNRHYYGSEISGKYCELAEKRINQYRSQIKLQF